MMHSTRRSPSSPSAVLALAPGRPRPGDGDPGLRRPLPRLLEPRARPQPQRPGRRRPRARGVLRLRVRPQRLRAARRRPRPGREPDLVLGGRFRTRLVTHSEDFPLDAALTVGLGAAFFDGSTVLRTPDRAQPRPEDRQRELRPELRALPAARPGADVLDDDSELELALGLGLDVRLTRRFDLRVSGGSATSRASRSASPGCASPRFSPARRSGPSRPRSASAAPRTRRPGCRSPPP